jgi:MYXO-CTERM domain-containing protein
MQLTVNARPARWHGAAAALAILALVGCSGGSGSGCGSSCGGALKTTDNNGQPIKFIGQKLDNVAQVRITKSGFDFLNAQHLNDLLTNLNGNAPAISIPCIRQNIGLSLCGLPLGIGTEFNAIYIGDTDFSGTCTAGEGPLAHINFKQVTWGFDQTNQILKGKLMAHIWTDPIYIRTEEAHSSLCGGNSPVQARVFYNDEPSDPLAQQDTELDLDIKFTPSPDGRMEINVTDASLNAIITRFDAGFIGIDGFSDNVACSGTNNTPCLSGWTCNGTRCVPPTGHYSHDACGSTPGTYNPESSPGNLNCGGVLRVINANCDPLDPNPKGLCQVFQAARDYLLNTLKNTFAPQIVNLLRGQIDKARCQRSALSNGSAVDCNNSTHQCGNDDNSVPLTCDTSRGVCVPSGQSPLDPGSSGGTVSLPDGGSVPVGEHNCEPIPLGLTGQLDVATLTDAVGFPPGAGLLLTLGLGSKTGAAAVDLNGVQLSAMAGTAPPQQNFVSICVPPSFWENQPQPPALNFDDLNNKPSNVGSYDLGLGVASQMLNRALFDSYSSGLLCITIDNHTTSFISSGLFKTFLPSLGLVTGGKDVPMAILLRPTQPPSVRIGKGTLIANPDGTYSPDDALITINFKAMNLDFYGLVDERQVRIFTLQADLSLPLGLRIMPDDSLQPVLGGLDTVLTNIKALNNEMLAEDPGVVRDLLGAAVRLAQPLLAGILKPVALPTMLGLKVRVNALTGVVPVSSNLAQDGYQHLAVYAQLAECGPLSPCLTSNVKTDAHVVELVVPEDAGELRDPNGRRPAVTIEAAALQGRLGAQEAEFSYRVDGSLWSPWVKGPRFIVRDPILMFQGGHKIEVIAREGGDDHTQDTEPVALDVFVSYEAPAVELVQRNDGSIATKASSKSSDADKLLYSYRIGNGSWTTPGPARVFTADEVSGRSLHVQVTDAAGKAATARIIGDDREALLTAGVASGCATSSSTTNAAVLGLLGFAAALWLRRQRRA